MDPIAKERKKEAEKFGCLILDKANELRQPLLPLEIGYLLISTGIETLEKYKLYKELSCIVDMLYQLDKKINDVDFLE